MGNRLRSSIFDIAAIGGAKRAGPVNNDLATPIAGIETSCKPRTPLSATLFDYAPTIE
jgi:hypothetical protein